MPADFKTKFEQQPFEGDYAYICLNTPHWARENGDEDEDEDDDDDEKDDSEEGGANFNKLFMKPASEHPDHKWILMKESLGLLSDNCKETMQRDPDNYGMYVHNDYFWYAVIDLIDKLCKATDTAFKAHDLHKAWVHIAALGHFLNHPCHNNS